MSMLDAMATGLPIIVSDKMGDVDRIKDCGLTYIEGDLNSLKERIKKLFDNNIRIQLGKYARKKAQNVYSWDIIANKLLNYYLHELAENKKLLE
jgi:glycosyltransferase involved in cell wall biosynthesis